VETRGTDVASKDGVVEVLIVFSDYKSDYLVALTLGLA
jgi:hypothetical protein